MHPKNFALMMQPWKYKFPSFLPKEVSNLEKITAITPKTILWASTANSISSSAQVVWYILNKMLSFVLLSYILSSRVKLKYVLCISVQNGSHWLDLFIVQFGLRIASQNWHRTCHFTMHLTRIGCNENLYRNSMLHANSQNRQIEITSSRKY